MAKLRGNSTVSGTLTVEGNLIADGYFTPTGQEYALVDPATITSGIIPKISGTRDLVDSLLSEDGITSTVIVSGNLTVNAPFTLSVLGTLTAANVAATTITSPTAAGIWNFTSAELNIAVGTDAERLEKGVGGTAELFWDTTNQILRIFDGTTIGGKTLTISGVTRTEALALILALS